jgi:hypothetical protein
LPAAPLPTAPTAKPITAAVPQTLLFDLQQRWSEVVQAAMRDGQSALATALTSCTPVLLAGGTLTLEAPEDLCQRSADDAFLLTSLARVVGQISGFVLPIRLRSVAGENRTRSERYQAAESNPLVQAIRKRFAADIISREPITRAEWLQRLQSLQTRDTPPDDNHRGE